MACNSEQLAAIERYASRHGRNWKADLRGDWLASHYFGEDADDACLLQQVRNTLGPSWLISYRYKRAAH